jgi:hypothetical protein
MIRLNHFLKDLGITFIISRYQDHGKPSQVYHISIVQYLFENIFCTFEIEKNQISFGIALEESLKKYGIKKIEEK